MIHFCIKYSNNKNNHLINNNSYSSAIICGNTELIETDSVILDLPPVKGRPL